MKRPLYIYIYISPSLARLRKFRGIRGFCAALTKPRLLSPPGQLAGGCLQTGFFTCEPQHAPEENFKSGGRPGLPAGGGESPAPGGHPAWSIRCWRPPSPARTDLTGQPARERRNRPASGGEAGTGRRRTAEAVPGLGCGRTRLSPGEARRAGAALPAQPAPPPGSGSGCAGLDSARCRGSPALAKYLISLHKLLFLACRLY